VSKELKDDTVIGKHKGFALICDPTVTLEIIANQLDDQNYTFWRIGKAACEAKDWKHEMFQRWEALECKCPDHFEAWVVDEVEKAYAAGVAASVKKRSDR